MVIDDLQYLNPFEIIVVDTNSTDKPREIASKKGAKVLEEPYSVFDESGAIGRRYARQDEIGTPFCITVDYDTTGFLIAMDSAGSSGIFR